MFFNNCKEPPSKTIFLLFSVVLKGVEAKAKVRVGKGAVGSAVMVAVTNTQVDTAL